jgi:hypothetical protein
MKTKFIENRDNKAILIRHIKRKMIMIIVYPRFFANFNEMQAGEIALG